MFEYYVKEVTNVVDGDTIDVVIDLGFDISFSSRVRLAGIDTPESRTTDKAEKVLGLEAKEYLKKAIKAAKTVVIKTEKIDSSEKYGRILGWVFLDGSGNSLNSEMIEKGYAWGYMGDTKVKDFDALAKQRALHKQYNYSMEYLIGSLLTAIVMLILFNKKSASEKKSLRVNIGYSQSHVYSLIRPYIYIDEMINKIKKDTQSSMFEKSMYVRVIFTNDGAYWIKDNTFYVADIEDGEVLKETTRVVDIMGMDTVELDKMSLIVERLREGLDDDYSNSGK